MPDTYKISLKKVSWNVFLLITTVKLIQLKFLFHGEKLVISCIVNFYFYIFEIHISPRCNTAFLINFYCTPPLIILFVLIGFVVCLFFQCLLDEHSLQIISVLLTFLSLIAGPQRSKNESVQIWVLFIFFLLATNG